MTPDTRVFKFPNFKQRKFKQRKNRQHHQPGRNRLNTLLYCNASIGNWSAGASSCAANPVRNSNRVLAQTIFGTLAVIACFLLTGNITVVASESSTAETMTTRHTTTRGTTSRGTTTWSTNSTGDLFSSQSDNNGSTIFAANDAALHDIAQLRARSVNPDKFKMPPLSLHGFALGSTGHTIGTSRSATNTNQYLGKRSNVLGKSLSPASFVSAQVFSPAVNADGWIYSLWNSKPEHGAVSGISAISQIKLVREAKTWKADLPASQMLDTSIIDGIFNASQGVMTPWDSIAFTETMPAHLTRIWNHPTIANTQDHQPKLDDNDRLAIRSANDFSLRESNPLRYGYVVELKDPHIDSASRFVRHYTTGRMGSGDTVFMPDGHTLYRNDNDSGYLFKFVSDYQHNLASGTLYVAVPVANKTTEGFNITWRKLARGNNEAIAAWVSEYEGMTGEDYNAAMTSFVSAEDALAWVEFHTERRLNDGSDVAPATDNRAIFLEPVSTVNLLLKLEGESLEGESLEGESLAGKSPAGAAALPLTQDVQPQPRFLVTGLTSSPGTLWATVESDRDESCHFFYSLPIDVSGNATHAQRVKPDSIGDTCTPAAVFAPHQQFLPYVGTTFATDDDTVYSMQYLNYP